MLYAAQLLENYKTKNQEKGRHTSTSTNLTAQSTYSAHASTSNNNIVEPVDSNDCDNEENVEDTENLDLSMCNKDSRCTWDKNQTKLLLSLYKEYESKLREGKITHRKFWIIISNQLKLKGYTFTSNQCKFKLDSLKRKYKVIVDHNS
ncbi:uncharacterized protein LOC107981497 [Nasonia vitripennis]|uniref:Myb/SANT-like DNA-binding domain-containing protein n=1 Tax=Nasonia vitripennis TaxID=7425 RepID=A0A7M7Q503_NASVI|nr:uncharacterized protein LOC107981497 [Nasonia vitripennis]